MLLRQITSMRLWRYLRMRKTLVLSLVMATKMSLPCLMWIKLALSKFLKSTSKMSSYCHHTCPGCIFICLHDWCGLLRRKKDLVLEFFCESGAAT